MANHIPGSAEKGGYSAHTSVLGHIKLYIYIKLPPPTHYTHTHTHTHKYELKAAQGSGEM